MIWPNVIICHNHEIRNLQPNDTWVMLDGYRTCAYCGSVHPEELIKLLENGAILSGSTWKQGWPHKFYIYKDNERVARWLNLHLMDEGYSDAAILKLLDVLSQHSGIKWYRDEYQMIHFEPPHIGYKKPPPCKITPDDT